MKQGKTLQQLAAEIEGVQKHKRDMIADTRHVEMIDDSKIVVSNGSDETFDLTPISQRQIAARLGIPAKYADKMTAKAPGLLTHNVNEWFRTTPERRMVRTIGNRCRAFLSDSYQRIDNFEVAQVTLPILQEIEDVQIVSCELTETRMYIKACAPRVQGEVEVGDVVRAGVVISNSEVGMGAVRIQRLVERLVCKNGMILPDGGYSKNHVGARAAKDEAVYEMLSDEAKEADDKAILLKVRDIVKAAVDETVFAETVEQMAASREDRITGNPAKAVEVLADRMSLTKDEEGGVLRHLIEGGDLSRWGALNAITRQSQDIEDYDRATKFEELGGRILNLGKGEWSPIAEAA